MLAGIVLFSHMVRLHPRYVEGFTPAVAAMLGIGLAWAAAAATRAGRAGARCEPSAEPAPGALLVTLAIAVYYGERLLYGYAGRVVGSAGWRARRGRMRAARARARAARAAARVAGAGGRDGDGARGGAGGAAEGGLHRDHRSRQRCRPRGRAARATSSTR